MEIKDMNIEQIEARMAEIRTEMDADGADINALTAEVRSMNERKEELRKAEAAKAELRGMVAAGSGKEIRKFEEEKKMEERVFAVDSKEYRSAYLKHLMGRELTAEEQRAYTVASGATATITANRIIEKVRQHAPLLGRMNLIPATGGVIEMYVEGTVIEAKDHTENATIKADADTLTKITLTPAEITKMVQVSEASALGSIDAFEDYLTDILGKELAKKINGKIITAADGVAASAGTGITAATVQTMLGMIEGDDAVVLCNKKTLYTKLLPLEDKNKNSLVVFNGNTAYIYGHEVMPDGHLEDGVLLGGDFGYMAGAMSEDVNVKKQYDIDSNANKYLGVAVCDFKPAINAAFAKVAAGA